MKMRGKSPFHMPESGIKSKTDSIHSIYYPLPMGPIFLITPRTLALASWFSFETMVTAGWETTAQKT